MIRFADRNDLDAVISLWRRCFPGDEAFTEWFFRRIYNPAVTLLDEEDGKLCSMLQMLPYHLRDARGIRPVTYIYGACTAPENRRQHRMDRLLMHSFALDQAAGRAASILIPQEEWLYGFYDQFGYRTAFYTDSLIVKESDVQSSTAVQLTAADIPAMRALYEANAGVRLLRTDNDWLTQLELFDTLGIGTYGLKQQDILTCYAFVWNDGAEKLWAQEACGNNIPQLAQAILHSTGCSEIRVTTAGAKQKLGCIRYHDNTPVETGYFNLLFN